MCIILDACILPKVFIRSSKEHKEFEPVLKWLVCGKGKIVYGGKKYDDEPKKMSKYISIFAEFNRAGKLVKLDNKKVDEEEEKLIQKVNNTNFDDPHIVSIVIISKCRLLCTHDGRSFKYIKKSSLYPKGITFPKIYTKAANKDLLRDKNIAKICNPCTEGDKNFIKIFYPN